MAFDLQRNDFRRWLESKKLSDEVGYAQQPECCPLACYLEDQGIVGVAVTEDEICGDHWSITPPEWASRFVRDIDTHDELEPITAAAALQALAQA